MCHGECDIQSDWICRVKHHFDGSVQDHGNFIANALQLPTVLH